MQMSDKFAERQAMPGHDFGEQQCAYGGVTLGKIELGANSSGLFAAHQDVVFEHPLANVFEADRHFVNAAAITGCDFIEELRRGEGFGEVAADFSRAGEMPEQDREDLVRSDECAVAMHRSDAVAISIGGKPGIVAAAAKR